MEYKLLISDEAYWDIEDAIDYYVHIPSENLEKRFLERLKNGLEYVRIYPEHFTKKYKDLRIYNLKNFPYQIHYLIQKDEILVFGVFHEKSNPKSWLNRLKKS